MDSHHHHHHHHHHNSIQEHLLHTRRDVTDSHHVIDRSNRHGHIILRDVTDSHHVIDSSIRHGHIILRDVTDNQLNPWKLYTVTERVARCDGQHNAKRTVHTRRKERPFSVRDSVSHMSMFIPRLPVELEAMVRYPLGR